jgi:hypothetical protein
LFTNDMFVKVLGLPFFDEMRWSQPFFWDFFEHAILVPKPRFFAYSL